MKPRHYAMVLVFLGLGAAIYATLPPLKRNAKTSSCQSNLKQIGLAFSQYARDYDEKYPRAARWSNDLRPYLRGFGPNKPNEAQVDALLYCSNEQNTYAYNRFYSALPEALDDNRAQNPLVFDSISKSRDAHDFGTSWPASPRHSILPGRRLGFHNQHYTQQSPVLKRQTWGSNVLFADGHVALRTQRPVFKDLRVPPPNQNSKSPAPGDAPIRKG